MEDIATAGRLAARVRGVSAVYNKIRVANRPSRAKATARLLRAISRSHREALGAAGAIFRA
jgi:hypothetical protein